MKVAVFTSSRADFGILKNTLMKLNADEDINLKLYVSGSHLSDKYGRTIEEIYKTGITDIGIVNSVTDGYDPSAAAAGCGMAMIELAKLIGVDKPDMLILLGDRYELLIPAAVCVICRVPIMHIHGGEITEGAIDEQIRHAITKMSHIHLVSTEGYALNVSRMGEEDWRIQVTGALGLENVKKTAVLSYEEIKNRIGIDLRNRTFLCTYHPVTLESRITAKEQMFNLLRSLDEFEEYQIIFTSPGADPDSEIIIDSIRNYVGRRKNASFHKSLGSEMYINVARKCELVIGNSSSGIIEIPSLKIPTVNIGNRQKGREKAKSVIDCGYLSDEITKAISLAISKEFRNEVDKFMNPYDPYNDGEFSDRVIKIIKKLNTAILERNKQLDFNVIASDWNKFL